MKILRSRILLALGASTIASAEITGCGDDGASPGDGVGGGGAGLAGATAGGGSSGMTAGGGRAGAAGSSGSSGSAGSGGSSGSAGSSGSSGASGNSGASGSSAGGAAGGNGGSNATAGGGAGGEPVITIRRPFLVGSSLRSAEATERRDWALDLPDQALDLDSHAAEMLAASWQKDALEEHASVAAFARFTMLLLSVGAPPQLVTASQRASLDEIQHARACFALARRYGAGDVGPSSLVVTDSLTLSSLADITALTVEEGCVGETLGALLAAEQLAVATDPTVRRVLRKIAADEARHAELAWRFVRWALERGGAPVAARVRQSLASARVALDEVVLRDYGVDVNTWHAHGRLTCAEAQSLSQRGFDYVVVPCGNALFHARAARAEPMTSFATA